MECRPLQNNEIEITENYIHRDEDDPKERFLSHEELEEYKKIQEELLTFSKAKTTNKSDLRKSLLNTASNLMRLLILLENTPNQESTGFVVKAKANHRFNEYDKSSSKDQCIPKKPNGQFGKMKDKDDQIPRITIKRVRSNKKSTHVDTVDQSLYENEECRINVRKSDARSSQSIPIQLDNSTQMFLQKDEICDNQLNNEIEIVFECKNVKPSITSFAPQKLNYLSQNQLQDAKISEVTRATIKDERLDMIKNDNVEKSDINIHCEPNGQNEKKECSNMSEKSEKLNTHSKKFATMERRPENSSAKIAEKSMSCLTTKLLFRVHYLISSDSDTDYSDFDNFADLWRNGFDRSDVCSRKTLESWLDYMQSNGGIDNWKNTHPCFLLNNLTLAAYLMKSQFTNLSRKLFNDVRFSTADVEQILDDLHITDDSSKKYSNAILSISRKPITEEIVNNIFEPYKIRFMRNGENNSNVIEPAEPSLREIKDKLKKILDEAEVSDDEEESFVTDEESEVYMKVQESEEYKTVQEVILKFSKEKPDNESDLRKSLLNIIATSTRLLELLADTHNQESTSSETKTKSRKRHKSYEIENSLSCEKEVIMKKKKGHSMPKRYSLNELIPRVIIERIDPRRISQEKSRDLSLHDNAKNTKNNKRSDTESSQDIQFLQECSTLTLKNNEETHKNELSKDIEIEFECKNVKPTVTSFVSQNLNISIDCEPNNQNEKIPQLQLVEKSEKSVKSKVTSKSSKMQYKLKRHINGVHYGIRQ
ncbi:hypothetical protein TKK_0003301 [Trichogramma kaykai]